MRSRNTARVRVLVLIGVDALTHGKRVHFELPVAAPRHGAPGPLPFEPRRVDTSEGELPAQLSLLGGIAVEPEAEDGYGEKALVEHGEERRPDEMKILFYWKVLSFPGSKKSNVGKKNGEKSRNKVPTTHTHNTTTTDPPRPSDGDLREPQTQDAVEPRRQKGDPWLPRRLCKPLPGHIQGTPDRERVLGEISGKRPAAVLDSEPSAVALVGRRRSRVVAVMEPAGELPPGAGGRGNPEVGGARVEDDGELLRGGPEADLAVVLMFLGFGFFFFSRSRLRSKRRKRWRRVDDDLLILFSFPLSTLYSAHLRVEEVHKVDILPAHGQGA